MLGARTKLRLGPTQLYQPCVLFLNATTGADAISISGLNLNKDSGCIQFLPNVSIHT